MPVEPETSTALYRGEPLEPALPAQPEPQRPYSCRLLHDEQRKCAFGACDQRTIERLRKECLRDGGAAVKALLNDIALLNGPSVTITCISSGLQAVLGPIYDTPIPLARSIGWSWGSTRNTSRQPGKPFSLSSPTLTISHGLARPDRIPATSSLHRT
jgi:hypothetical protein